LYSTDIAFNCNVKINSEDQYLGRLYIFAAEEPTLLKLGIEKEWFLAHESGKFVVSGHINTQGQWCLSSDKSLEPSLAYTTQDEILDRVFSPEYMREILHFRSTQSLESSESVALESGSLNGGEDESSDGEGLGQFESIRKTDFETSIPNLNILQELLLRSSPEELQEWNEVEVQQDRTSLLVEQVESVPATMSQSVVIAEQGKSNKLDEAELLNVQDALIDKIIDEYRERDTSEFVFTPFGTVTVHVEEDYFVLRSPEDGHTILAATLSGAVLDRLNEAEASEFANALYLSEVEVSQDKASQHEIQALKRTSYFHQSKGLDYGA